MLRMARVIITGVPDLSHAPWQPKARRILQRFGPSVLPGGLDGLGTRLPAGAKLNGIKLNGIQYDNDTKWPEGFDIDRALKQQKDDPPE